MPSWDPARYLAFADHRARPFADLVARVGARAPALVLDVGCGPGALTAALAARWASARVLGVDSSPDMVAAAAADPVTAGVEVVLGDLLAWEPPAPADVVVSNAVLQWTPEPARALERLAGWVAPGGWLAVQVPGNGDAPTHRLLAEVAGSGPWAERLEHLRLERVGAPSVEEYAEPLEGAFEVDAWETTYRQVVAGADAVLRWVSGTALRPVLDALADEPAQREAFVDAYRARLRDAYPQRADGTSVLPFRRAFCVARRR